MALKQILPGLYTLAGRVNVFLLDAPDDPEAGLILIDTGFLGAASEILDAVRSLGRQPSDIRHILLTHAHPDHIGGSGALQTLVPAAQTWMHPTDAPIARAGTGFRPLHASPGLINGIFTAFVKRNVKKHPNVDPTRIDHEVEDGAVLPIAGGITAIHAPGHCAGQLVFLWPQHGGVLFAADSCMDVLGLDLTIAYEDINLGRQSLRRVAQLPFENACFGHGKPIIGGASTSFRKHFANA